MKKKENKETGSWECWRHKSYRVMNYGFLSSLVLQCILRTELRFSSDFVIKSRVIN